MAIQYLDFDLLIERSGDRYRARVLDSPAGEASGDFSVPFTPEDINNFFVQIGQTRSFETQQTRRIREFGQSLFEAVFTGTVRDRLRASLGEVSLHSNGLRIRLRLSGTPELGNLPWEFLYDPGASRFLALSVETPVVRYLETQQMAQPFAVQPPLRILTVICGPQDYPRLDTEREWENLQESMRGLQSRGLVDLQRLDPPTLSALQQQLRRDQYHIFHFIGHGIFSRNEQDGYLLFENALRGGQRVSGHDLGTILHDHRPLRLAVLNACEGARASMEDQFAGSAQSLIQQGIPAVIAMQFRITDQASIMLAHEFYGALADGYPVDAALTEARKAIKIEGNDLEWGTPVLYMRTPDGRLFDILGQPAAVRIHPSQPVEDIEKTYKLDQLYTEGLEAFYLGQWESAAVRFQAIVDSRPDYRDASAKLETIHHKLAVQSLESQAKEAEGSANWGLAVEALENLAAKEPAFPGIAARLANARRQSQLARMLDEAEHLAQAERWGAVLGIFKEMEKIEPHHSDPSGLRARAEQALAREKTAKDLESFYNSALQGLEAGDTQTAMRHLRRVRQIQPGYRESEQLLNRLETVAKGGPKVKKEKPVHAKAEPATVPAIAFPSNAIFLEGWLPVLFGLVFVIGDLLLVFLNKWVDYNTYISNSLVLITLHWLPFGVFWGLLFQGFLSRAIGSLTLVQVVQVVGGSAVCTWIIGAFIKNTGHSEAGWYFAWGVFGVLFGALVAGVLRSRGEIAGPRQFITLILGWGLIFWFSSLTGVKLGEGLGDLLPDEMSWRSGPALMFTLAAVGGAWLTLSCLKANRGREVVWKTILAGALGFSLGNLITSPLWQLYGGPVSSPIWGFIGGAALAYPSRDIKRYLGYGLAVGFSMLLGELAGKSYAVFFWCVSGALSGLILGLNTRRVSGITIGSILGFSVFMMIHAFTQAYTDNGLPSQFLGPLWFLVTALGGAILAAGWTYLRGSAPSLSETPG